MSRNGISFDPELQQSKGDFLNLKEKEITRLIGSSDGRSEEQLSRQKRLREKYLPEIPGYVPKNPIYKAEFDRYLDYLVDLRSRAGQVCLDAPLVAQLSLVRSILKTFTSTSTITSPIQTALGIVRSYSDGLAECDKARINMMVEFNKKCVEYIAMGNAAYQSEKRNSTLWQVSEMDRAYVSFNRYEHFFLGGGFAGIHHAVSNSVAAMEKVYRGEQERLGGASFRRGIGMFGDSFELVLPAVMYGKSAGSKVKDAYGFAKDKILSFFNNDQA